MERIFPRALEKGMMIALAAPSGAVRNKETTERYRAFWEERGYRVKVLKSCSTHYGYLSGNDRERAEEMQECFLDDKIDAIFCVFGGYGAARVLPLLDYESIRSHPKIFAGFSDVTGYHSAIFRHSGLVTFHTPNADLSSGKPGWEFSFDSMLACLTCREKRKLLNPEGMPLFTANGGKAEGIACGGNLSLIAHSIGTGYEPEFDGRILFLEDVGEKIYSVDRMLTQLRLAGVFDRCAGIVFGMFSECRNAYPDFGLTLEQVINDVVLPCGKPVLTGLCFGHQQPSLTFPLGVRVTLDADRREGGLNEAAVQ